MKNIYSKNNFEHSYTDKSLLLIYLIHNYIMYKSVFHILNILENLGTF